MPLLRGAKLLVLQHIRECIDDYDNIISLTSDLIYEVKNCGVYLRMGLFTLLSDDTPQQSSHLKAA